MKLKPLRQWTCDDCGQLIARPQDGWLEWLVDFTTGVRPHGFRIVHHRVASPTGSCYYTDRLYPDRKDGDRLVVYDDHLRCFLGGEGLLRLLAFCEDGEWGAAKPAELAEIIRRLHVPDYEEARRRGEPPVLNP